jgi:hypothetical protein
MALLMKALKNPFFEKNNYIPKIILQKTSNEALMY